MSDAPAANTALRSQTPPAQEGEPMEAPKFRQQSGSGIIPAQPAANSPSRREGFKFVPWSAHKSPKTERKPSMNLGYSQIAKSLSPDVQDVQTRTENIALNSPPGQQGQNPMAQFAQSSESRPESKTAGNASRSRATRNRRSTGKRRGQPLDPDYDRSLQSSKEGVDEPVNRTSRRLFDPNRDDVIAFQTLDQSSKANQDEQSPVHGGKGAPESRKESRRDNRLHTVVAPEIRPIIIHQRAESGMDPRDSISDPPTRNPMTVPDTSDTNSQENSKLKMIKQPETRQISAEQLIAEVKGIYAGLIMVEAKCCEVDEKQHHAALETDGRQPPMLNNEQWQALIALHRTLLHEHHDFFLASQHPAASPSLKRLAQKYAMPARMWRHGIHSFLELLRHRLPHSLEHMLTFIYLAYSMMALLYETVPTFEDTWIECLGDLARYRMAIEDDDMRDREVWQEVARHWYSKAADKTPHVGRLYHHLAILARPNLLRQLFFYCKSLGVSQPFSSARESVLTVFEPIFNADVYGTRSSPIDSSFIQLHGTTFAHTEFERFDESRDSFLDTLDKHIGKPQSKFKVQGFYEGGKKTTGAGEEMVEAPAHASTQDVPDGDMESLTETPRPGPKDAHLQENQTKNHAAVSQTIQEISLNVSKRIDFRILSLTLERVDNSNVAIHWRAWMVFLRHVLTCPSAAQLLEDEFPWDNLVDMLNYLRSKYDGDQIDSEDFTTPGQDAGGPLPEDYHIRGFDWARRYFPDGWFDDAQEHEDLDTEVPAMGSIREERILWLAMRIYAADSVLAYDPENRTFSIHEALKARQEQRMRMLVTGTKKDITISADEESDVEMSAAAYNNSGGENYIMVVPEPMRKLQERKRQLEAQLANPPIVTPEALAEVIGAAIVKGPEALDHEYTIVAEVPQSEVSRERSILPGNTSRCEKNPEFDLDGADMERKDCVIKIGKRIKVANKRKRKLEVLDMTGTADRETEGKHYMLRKWQRGRDLLVRSRKLLGDEILSKVLAVKTIKTFVQALRTPSNEVPADLDHQHAHLLVNINMPIDHTDICVKQDFNGSRVAVNELAQTITSKQHSIHSRRLQTGLCGELNGELVHVLADTGSRYNVMEEGYARNREITINYTTTCAPYIELANGRLMPVIGTVKVVWNFEDSLSTPQTVIFRVAKVCPNKILFGNKFLKKNDWMAQNFSHRLVTLDCYRLYTPNLMLVNFMGYNNDGIKVTAYGNGKKMKLRCLIDTGCANGNVLSGDKFRSSGLSRKPSNVIFVFPDGTTQPSDGRVEMSISLDRPKRNICIALEVMEGCKYDAILGHDLVLEHGLLADTVNQSFLTVMSDSLSCVFLQERSTVDPEQARRLAQSDADHARSMQETARALGLPDPTQPLLALSAPPSAPMSGNNPSIQPQQSSTSPAVLNNVNSTASSSSHYTSLTTTLPQVYNLPSPRKTRWSRVICRVKQMFE